jgi:hypothetical protein
VPLMEMVDAPQTSPIEHRQLVTISSSLFSSKFYPLFLFLLLSG